jgi:hypothetical protein
MLFAFETAAARRGGSEEPRYQFSANSAINCTFSLTTLYMNDKIFPISITEGKIWTAT